MRIPFFLPMPGDAIEAPGASSRVARRMSRRMRRAVAGIRRWWLEQRTLEEIDRLDPATLRDIGVGREQVRAEFQAMRERALARERAWQIRP